MQTTSAIYQQKTLWRVWWNQLFFSSLFCSWTLKIFQLLFKWWNLFSKMGWKNGPALKSNVYKSFGEPLFTKDTLTCMMKSAFFPFHPFFCSWSLKILQLFFKLWNLFLKMGWKKNDPTLKFNVYKSFGGSLFAKDTLTCMMKSAFFYPFHPFFCSWSLRILQFFFKWWNLFLKMGWKKWSYT